MPPLFHLPSISRLGTEQLQGVSEEVLQSVAVLAEEAKYLYDFVCGVLVLTFYWILLQLFRILWCCLSGSDTILKRIILAMVLIDFMLICPFTTSVWFWRIVSTLVSLPLFTLIIISRGCKSKENHYECSLIRTTPPISTLRRIGPLIRIPLPAASTNTRKKLSPSSRCGILRPHSIFNFDGLLRPLQDKLY